MWVFVAVSITEWKVIDIQVHNHTVKINHEIVY